MLVPRRSTFTGNKIDGRLHSTRESYKRWIAHPSCTHSRGERRGENWMVLKSTVEGNRRGTRREQCYR